MWKISKIRIAILAVLSAIASMGAFFALTALRHASVQVKITYEAAPSDALECMKNGGECE